MRLLPPDGPDIAGFGAGDEAGLVEGIDVGVGVVVVLSIIKSTMLPDSRNVKLLIVIC